MAKDLNDPVVGSGEQGLAEHTEYETPHQDDEHDVALRNGSPDVPERVEYGVVDTVPDQHPVHAFILHHAQPYESPGRSARNHWQLVTVFALLGMLLGATVGFLRPPAYTAESRLVVGKTAQLSNLASIPGLDAAGQSLAASYSRLASTAAVQTDAAKRLGGSLGGSFSASPIPLSPIVRVEASASSAEQASRIAKAASDALIDQVNTLNTAQSKASDDVLKQYQDADQALIAAQINVNNLRQQYTAQVNARASQSVLDNLQTQVNAAQTQVDAAQVKMDALAKTYSGIFSPTALNSQVLQSTGAPAATGNNRQSTIEIGLLVGLVAGGLLGLGLAMWTDLRARSRTRVQDFE